MASLSIAPGVLGELALFFAVAFLLLTYLGAGISALTLPGSLRAYGWLVAPYAGFSLLAAVSAALVACGADMRTSLVAALAFATAANGRALRGDQRLRSLGSIGWWVAMCAMAIPLYAVPALTMAHNGSTAYVGGQGDLTYVLTMAEWLKSHTAPVLTLGSGPIVNPYWIGNFAPLGGWNRVGAHLSFTYPISSDTQISFQRGMTYLQAALGIVLNRDNFLVYRPTLAFMLSLSLPAVFLFCRRLVGASLRASLLAALFLGLNGTVFFWVAYGHLGQTVAASLLPVAVVVTVAAMESRERRAALAASLLISALLVSYYQAISPILAVMLAPAALNILIKSERRRDVMVQIAVVGLGVVLMALPEHVKMVLAWRAGGLMEVPGWNDQGFVPLSDAFGTTLLQRAFDPVMGQGQASPLILSLYQYASIAATVVAALVALVGLVRRGMRGTWLYRYMLLGAFGLLVFLRVINYPYGYSKAQAMVAFLVAVAMALGIDSLWGFRAVSARALPTWLSNFAPDRRVAAAGISLLVLSGMLSVNFALSDYAFWKPVGNIWDPRAWEASALTESLPSNAEVEISPDILTAPEPLFATLYFLRNQVLEGVFSLGGTFGKRVLVLPQASTAGSGGSAGPAFDVLGTSEIAAAKGLIPSDLVWAGSIVNAYRHGDAGLGGVAVRSAAGAEVGLPAHLPATVEVQPGAQASGGGTAGQTGYLLFVLAADGPATVGVTAGPEERSFQIGPGVSVRSIRLRSNDRVVFDETGGARVQLLTATARMDGSHPPPPEDYPEALAAVGQSKLEGNVISTRFSYLDIGVLAFHSVDIYNADSNSHQAWFDLPTYPDKQLRDVQFDFNAATLDHQTFLDGADAPRRSTAEPSKDGDYVACFSIWTVRSLVKSIPIYRYRLEGGKVTNFEPFDLTGVWDGRTVAVGG